MPSEGKCANFATRKLIELQEGFPSISMLPSIDVVIVTWNRKKDLARALDSLRRQTFQPNKVVVVDNGSTDGTVESFEAPHPGAVLVELGENLGACHGRNIGFQRCESELVFFLDDDSEPDEDCLERVAKVFEDDEKVGSVQPDIVIPSHEPDSAGEKNSPGGIEPNPHPISAAWCVRREALPNNPWPEHFERQGEEMWVAFHLYRGGYTNVLAHGPKCLHHQAPGGQREKVFFFFTRNSFLLYYQRFPLLLMPPVALYKLLRTLINVRTFGQFRAWVAGAFSAFRLILSGKAPRDAISYTALRAYFRDLRSRGG